MVETTIFFFYSSVIFFAGEPATFRLSGISFKTTEPAPIITFLPILIFGKIIDPAPIKEHEPTLTFPQIVTPGPT